MSIMHALRDLETEFRKKADRMLKLDAPVAASVIKMQADTVDQCCRIILNKAEVPISTKPTPQDAPTPAALVAAWLDLWEPGYWAPREVFAEQLRALLSGIFDAVEERAEANMIRTQKLEGMHYAALREVRRELGVERKKPDEIHSLH
jgi:hypothetical protein